jgi:vancomycin resistance protein YoaR
MAKAAPVVGTQSRRVLVLAGGVVLGIAALFVLASVTEHVMYSGSVLPGVRIDGTHVSGKKDSDARASIDALSAQLETTAIHVKAGTKTFVFAPNVIGFTVDRDATIRQAREAGRNTNPLTMVTDTVLRRFRPEVVPLVVHYDNARFEGLFDGWANAVRAGLVEGNIKIIGTTVVPVAPRAGHGLLRADAERKVRAALSSGTRHDLELPLGAVSPNVGQAAVDAAAARARALLTGTYTVVSGATRVTLTSAQIAPILATRANGHKLDLTIAPDKLRLVLGPAFSAAEVAPVDATFNLSNPNAVTVVPSQDGHQLNTEALAAAILRGNRTITATFRNQHPVHDTKWAQSLGITHQVSSFTTYHPAGQPRVENIHRAADVLDNTVVLPGQTFSLNDKLGPRTPEKGYVKAPILVEDGFGEDYGGGISQLTTTLYNAVFFGGYVDVSHSPHHFYITRYPLGREATIVFPYVDLKFRNDTKHGVLIHAYYSATSVTVTFYGNTDGRVATEANRKIIHTEVITDRLVDCPAKKPTDDPNNKCATLAAGERLTTATGETGYDVEFDRVITQPGKATITQHYRVHYPMLQNTVLVGKAPPVTTTTTVKPTTTTKPKTPTTKRTTVTTKP